MEDSRITIHKQNKSTVNERSRQKTLRLVSQGLVIGINHQRIFSYGPKDEIIDLIAAEMQRRL